jgi:3-oxoacyl-[acyl-carrier-protein] synthase II
MTRSSNLRIRGLSVVSAVGANTADWSAALQSSAASISRPKELGGRSVFSLAASARSLVEEQGRKPTYRKLDRTTLLALAAANSTIARSGKESRIGCVTLGSSRGPTQTLESTYEDFLREEGRVPLLTSPATTAGNLASWVAQSCLFEGDHLSEQHEVAAISTSMTCSSAFHSLLVATSFIKANLAQACLFGGAEACLTAYTVAQLEALRIYTTDSGPWPCRPFCGETSSANSVTLGEAAGTALLLPGDTPGQDGDLELLGLGWSMEEIPSATGISHDGAAFQRSMRMAAAGVHDRAVDAVIAHAPGSLKGDRAELQAIRAVFGDVLVCTTKHLSGHTYASSGMVSLSLAQALLDSARWQGLPYPSIVEPTAHKPGLRVIAINTAGFGGNAITAIVGKSD